MQGVDAQISAVAGGKVKDLQSKVDDLAKKIDKVITETTKLKVAINTSIRLVFECLLINVNHNL